MTIVVLATMVAAAVVYTTTAVCHLMHMRRTLTKFRDGMAEAAVLAHQIAGSKREV